MNSRMRIVRLLSDGRFHSGQEIAAWLSVSRAAVWKQLQTVRTRYGLKIHAVRGRGYRIADPVQLFEKEAILAGIPDSPALSPVQLEILDSVDSTNRYLMQKQHDDLCSGHVCLAEQQTSGRGRRGRSWISPFGRNIYLSIYWRYEMEMAGLSGLSLAAGVAVAECLGKLGIGGVGLKWPNDLHWQERKLGGLLLEVSGEQGGPNRVVLGLGLNLSMQEEQAADIDQPWAALSHIPGAERLDRNRLTGEVISALLGALVQYGDEGLEPFVQRWEAWDQYLGQPVTLTAGKTRLTGIHRGIDASGALLLESNGTVTAHYGGEVSLRKAGP